MCHGEREKAIIPFSDQFRPYYTTIDICPLRLLQISVDRVLRTSPDAVLILRRLTGLGQLNAKFLGVRTEAGRWHVPYNNERRFSILAPEFYI